MEDDILNAVDDSTLPGEGNTGHSPEQSPEKDDAKHKGKDKSRWRSLSALKAQASMQDKLLEKLLQQVMPDLAADGTNPDGPLPSDASPTYESTRPPFSAALMATNFARFNARIGVVFKFQSRLVRLLAWRKPSQTLSLLAVYTLVCLDPYLLSVIPLAVALVGVFIPSFMARHPPSARELTYSPHGPPRAPARTVKPAKHMSHHFLKNMGDLQNSMEDFSRAHDQIVTSLVPKTNFSDEALSSALFVALFAVTLFMSIAAHLLPWRAIALCAGWTAIVSGHPAVGKMLQETQAAYFPRPLSGGSGKMGKGNNDTVEEKAQTALNAWAAGDIMLDSAPETREVEIFELQHLNRATGGGGEWEAWVFSPSPYDPLSQARITGQRPRGTRFFEDVAPPEGWAWSEKKWALDLWSREWVEERIITGVEVETEGERWVYDMFDENEGVAGVREEGAGSGGGGVAGGSLGRRKNVSWEEGEEGEGRRGEWRRRRWVRLVRRRETK